MKRSIRFGLLLNAVEKWALAQLADNAGGLSQGAMLRNLIRKEARRRGFLPTADQCNEGSKSIGDGKSESDLPKHDKEESTQ